MRWPDTVIRSACAPDNVSDNHACHATAFAHHCVCTCCPATMHAMPQLLVPCGIMSLCAHCSVQRHGLSQSTASLCAVTVHASPQLTCSRAHISVHKPHAPHDPPDTTWSALQSSVHCSLHNHACSMLHAMLPCHATCHATMAVTNVMPLHIVMLPALSMTMSCHFTST